MSKPSNPVSVLTALLLSVTSAACGRAAVTSHPRHDGELHGIVRDETLRASKSDADSARLEDPAGPRALRLVADDSLQNARAIRNEWAASDAR